MSRDYYRDDDVERYSLVEDQIDQFELVEEEGEIDDLEIPEVRWKEDIKKIPNIDVQLEEIEEAKKFLKEEKVLGERVDNGDMSIGMYESIIKPKMRKATTRCGLASVGLSYDHLGDVAEDAGLLATGDLKMTKLKDRVKKTIDDIGPDAAQELADNMLNEEKIRKDAHDHISRQTRLQKPRNK
jgi:hypothetical protein